MDPQDSECHKTDKNSPDACPKVIIALGGNIDSAIGPPALTIEAALARLSDSFLCPSAVSPLYATPCFPAGAGPDYVNAAAVFSGPADAHQVLDLLHRIEAEFGRERQQRWGQRTLDLDLIAMGDAVLPDEATFRRWRDLPADRQPGAVPKRPIVPHPRLQDRAFVLIPLLAVAPDWRHPVGDKTVAEMANDLTESDRRAIRPL